MKFIFETTKGYRVRFCLLLGTILFATGSEALFPFAIGKIVDEIFYNQQMKGFLLYFSLYAGLYLFNQCSHGGLNYLWAKLEATYVVDIRKKCFKHLLRLPAAEWVKIKSGDVMNRMQNDTECFLEFIHRSVFYAFANLLQLCVSIGYLFLTNVYLGLVAIVLTPIMTFSIRFFTAKLRKQYGKIRTGKGLTEAFILEMMTGISEWKLLNAHGKVKRDYLNQTKEVVKEEMKAGYTEIYSSQASEVLTLIGQLFIYGIAAFCIKDNTITMGQFVACAAYFTQSATYFNALGKKLTSISGNMVGIKRIIEFMQLPEEQDTEGAKDLIINQGNITIRNVDFSYQDELVLKDFSLKIESGEHIAFVGKSGEGKSTLLSLLQRFYTPLRGEIEIDGKPISSYTIGSLRSQLAVVQQENGLFHGTLYENITFGAKENKICTETSEKVWEILNGLHLKELIEQMPDGLNTVIGTGDRELSGGQKQRIAIARAVYRNPKILLLDEATSALDEESEKVVNDYLYKTLPDTTILSVAHRFSTVLSAGKAIVIEQGKVAASGTHEELLKVSKLYRDLYEEYRNASTQMDKEAADE